MTTALALTPLPAVELLSQPATTAADIATRWLLGYAGNTRAAYQRDLLTFGAWCDQQGGLDPLKASRAHLELYARGLEAAGRAKASVARALTALTGFYGYAVDEGLIDRNPAAKVRRPKLDDDDAGQALGLDRGQMQAFLDEANRLRGREAVVASLLALNGLRASEIASAQVEDISTEQGHRTLTITRKGGRRARLPLAPPTGVAIDTYLDGRTTGPLVLGGRDSDGITRHSVAHIVERVARRAGIGHAVTPHTVRHGWVTESLAAGVALHDVQDAAGHRDPRTTQRYNRARHSLDAHPAYVLAARYATGRA